MVSKKTNGSVITIFLLLILLCVLVLLWSRFSYMETYSSSIIVENEYVYGTKETSKIPNIIWSFWDGPPNKFVDVCIKTWAEQNPTYQINIVTKQNYKNYIDVNVDAIKHSKDFIARYSDYIRSAILSKYGGIWSDASIICQAPYSWIHGIQTATNAEFICYFSKGFTKDEFLHSSPVIENWFFACVPNSKFMTDWCNEFLRTRDFSNIDDYVNDVKNDGVNVQNIDSTNYLAMHVAAQKVLQKNEGNYNIAVIDSCVSAFKFLCDTGFDNKKSVDNLLDDSSYNKYKNDPILKFTGDARKTINTALFGNDDDDKK